MAEAEIEAARAECDRTFRRPADGRSPCLLPEYLEARRAYHRLLVRFGRLDPEFADK